MSKLLSSVTRLLPGVLFVLFIFQLQGCAYAPQVAKLDPSVINVATSQELEQVPFFPQSKYQCGPAALATVLSYRQLSVLPEDLIGQVYVPNREGSFQLEMVAAARQYGLTPYLLEPSVKDLLVEVNAGNPVLVLQNVGLDVYPQWHFAVVVGYDLQTSQIILRSGTTERWITSLRNFEQTWRKSDYWGLVITRPTQIPVTASSAKWLSTAYDLEQVRQTAAAEAAYQAATQRWPDQESVWLGLTNFQYGQQRFADALLTFNRILPGFMDSSRLWNNYAYVLKANQCHAQAKAAAQCAVKLLPGDVNLQGTLREMNALPVSERRCASIQCE